MSFAQIGGHAIYYELVGEGDGPLVTFVNGLTQSAALWTSYTDYFVQRGHRVLVFDMLGQGQSAKPVLFIEMDDHPRLLRELIAHVGAEESHVVGISFGGIVAMKYALAYPETVRGLVVMSTFGELTAQLSRLGACLYQGLTQVGLPYLQDLLLPMNFSSQWLARNEAAIPALKRRGYAGNDLYAVQNLMESFTHFAPFAEELPGITCPTLIVNGEFDFLTPRESHEALRQRIANSRLMIIQHAYHAFTLEFPEITMRVIKHFIDSVEDDTWIGDRSVWIAGDDPGGDEVAYPCKGDHMRAVPPPIRPKSTRAATRSGTRAKPRPRAKGTKHAADAG